MSVHVDLDGCATIQLRGPARQLAAFDLRAVFSTDRDHHSLAFMRVPQGEPAHFIPCSRSPAPCLRPHASPVAAAGWQGCRRLVLGWGMAPPCGRVAMPLVLMSHSLPLPRIVHRLPHRRRRRPGGLAELRHLCRRPAGPRGRHRREAAQHPGASACSSQRAGRAVLLQRCNLRRRGVREAPAWCVALPATLAEKQCSLHCFATHCCRTGTLTRILPTSSACCLSSAARRRCARGACVYRAGWECWRAYIGPPPLSVSLLPKAEPAHAERFTQW